ncbi:MAG: hypothetical protein MJ214_05510 [Bacilli bacterium]|nr:hypothetical protein [Bacilli bacterium]
MASQNRFAITPTVSISRSKFKRNSQHKTTIKIGEITPIYLDEVLPGDTRSIDMAGLLRMNTPVVPLMDNIHVDYYAFFCPNRLVWKHWKEFMGENTSSAGIYQGAEYKVPTTEIGYDEVEVGVGSVGDHLGLPIFNSSVGTTYAASVSSLPGRMYDLIYNEWFRDQNLIAPITLADDDSTSYNYAKGLYKAAKVSDYFTRALPYAQKGAPVTIPLGTTAPIFVMNDTTYITPAHSNLTIQNMVAMAGKNKVSDAEWLNSGTQTSGHLLADLSKATAATINDLRFAFQYQKLLERDALYGTRYWEILKGHFGISAPDATLQRPELLGHFRMNVNIDQVLQTTGQDVSTPSSNELGNTGAVSVTGGKGHLCSKSFVEHGYIMILAVARHDQTYGQGISRDWSRKTRTDYYFPEFANLGAQKILNKEIRFGGTVGDEEVFGFQEGWAEYRYKPSQVTGILRPNVANSLGYWTLASNFAQTPTLSQSFIEQSRSNILRATSDVGFDFICDFAFQDVAVRPMPVYSVPGLIDHH